MPYDVVFILRQTDLDSPAERYFVKECALPVDLRIRDRDKEKLVPNKALAGSNYVRLVQGAEPEHG